MIGLEMLLKERKWCTFHLFSSHIYIITPETFLFYSTSNSTHMCICVLSISLIWIICHVFYI